MTVKELAGYIREHKDGNSLHYSYDDVSVLMQHTRTVFRFPLCITEQHIFDCCEKSSDYDEYIELCRPFVNSDTEAFQLEKNKPAPKGRTRRRFK